MNKFTNDSNTLSLQSAAYAAAEREQLACDDFLAGAISEDSYIQFMAKTALAVELAVLFGISRKDLPAV